MSRWTYSTITFTDPAAENPEENADGAILLVPITSGSVAPGDPFTVKVLWYHPASLVTYDTPTGTGEDATALNVGQGTEIRNETVQLAYGRGTASVPDVNGNTNVYDVFQKDSPVGYKDISYTVSYITYELTSSTEGEHEILFMFLDETHITSQKFTVESAPTPVYRPTTLEIYNEQTDAIISGASVWVDGSLIGTTDANGRIDTGDLEVGTTHTLKVTATDYIDSDLDDIANDTFVAQ